MVRREGGARWLALAAVMGLGWALPGQAVAACGASKVGNDLQFVSNSTVAQAILIQDDGTTLTVFIDCAYNGVTPDYTAVGDTNGQTFTGIETIHAAPGGKDTLSYVQSGPWNGVVRYLGLLMGPYTNYVTVTLNNTISAHSSLAVEIWGGANQDFVTLDLAGATLTDSALYLYGDLGTGWDHLSVTEPQATGNSKVDVEFALGSGRNNYAEVSAKGLVSGSHYRVAIDGDNNGDQERDTVYLDLGATFDNDSRFLFTTNLRGGNDIFTGYLSSWPPTDKLQVLNGSEVRLRANGNAGNDYLAVSQGYAPGNLTVDGLLEIVLRGGLHNDNLDTSLSGIAGTGTVRVREHGGVYPDIVTFGVMTDPAATNNLDILVQGGRGLDVLSGGLFAGAGVTFSPLGAAVLDGSVEPDRCLTFGDPDLQTVSCELAF